MKHKKQHFVPQSYLKAWCDPDTPKGQEPYVWKFSKDGTQIRKKSPSNIFHEREMYTIKQIDGSRDLRFEHGLSELETLFVNLKNRKINKRVALKEEDKFIICAIIAAMHARTKSQRDHWSKQWGETKGKMEKMMEWAKTLPPEKKKALAVERPAGSVKELNYEEINKLTSDPMQHMLLPSISTTASLLYKVKNDIVIFETTDSLGFLTSDAPCVWFDPEAYKRPPMMQVPGLLFPTTEIRFPVSPTQMIILQQHGENRYIKGVPTKIVDEMNRLTRFYAAEYFIVKKNVKKDIWFDPGVEPEDSWRKKQLKEKQPNDNKN